MAHSTPKHTGGQSLLKAVLKGTFLFLILAVVATLRFTSVAPLLIMLIAAGIGYYGSNRMGQREFIYSGLVTLPANILLQLLYFADIGQFLDTVDILIIAGMNTAIIALFALLGGLIAFIRRKHRENKEQQKRCAEEQKNDTRWIDRLVASVVLFFYLTTYVLPVTMSVSATTLCPSQNLSVDEFVECYDPDASISTKGTSEEQKVERNMTLDGASEYYGQYPEVPQEVIDNLLMQCGSVNCDITAGIAEYKEQISSLQIYESIGIPPWQQTYPEVHGFTKALWGNTIGGFINLAQAFSQDFWGTSAQVLNGIGTSLQRAKMFTDPGYAALRLGHHFKNDIGAYYGAAAKKIKNGKVLQGLGDMFNVPKLIGSVVDRRYAGGTKQLAKDIRNPATITKWAVQAGAISPETGRAIQQKNYRYAIGNGVGEVTGVVLTLAFPGVVKAGTGKIAQLTKTTATMNELATGTLTTKNGINVRGYTHHGFFDRKIGRKVPTMDIVDGLKNPLKIHPIVNKPQGPSQRFIGKNAEVVANPENGKIVSVNKTKTKKSIKLQQQK